MDKSLILPIVIVAAVVIVVLALEAGIHYLVSRNAPAPTGPRLTRRGLWTIALVWNLPFIPIIWWLGYDRAILIAPLVITPLLLVARYLVKRSPRWRAFFYTDNPQEGCDP